MNQITYNIVELNDIEMRASDDFEKLLDRGYNIDQAIDCLTTTMGYTLLPEFIEWLR